MTGERPVFLTSPFPDRYLTGVPSDHYEQTAGRGGVLHFCTGPEPKN
jgi:hypothetical protein